MEAKWKKLIANRDRAVADVASYNQLIEEAIERKSRTVKLDRFVDECTKAFQSAVEFNQSLVQLASGAENASQLVPPLESWLEEFVQNHDDRMQYYKTARAAAPPAWPARPKNQTGVSTYANCHIQLTIHCRERVLQKRDLFQCPEAVAQLANPAVIRILRPPARSHL